MTDPKTLFSALLRYREPDPRRALFELLGQGRTRGIAGRDLDAALGGIGRIDLVERILHRGGGEHGKAFVLRRCRREGRSEQDRESEQRNSGKTVHGALHAHSRRHRAQIGR